jgi:tRNA uridine 5-carboxymethylaminomethyl modification enzyme
MAKWRKSSNVRLPHDLSYDRETFPSFSAEELEKLSANRPETIHAAGQIQGITPHAVIYLHNYILKRKHHRPKPPSEAELVSS